MCICEESSASRQSIDIGRFDLRMTSETAEPVILVVNRNEQDIRLVSGIELCSNKNRQDRNEVSHDCSDFLKKPLLVLCHSLILGLTAGR